MANLWDYDEPINTYAEQHDELDWPEPPEWIEQDISPADVAAIVQGGCASGAYMPAVTYWQALETMSEHGDDVLDALDGMDLSLDANFTSWAGLACYIVSAAVETWAASVEDELSDALDELEEDEDA